MAEKKIEINLPKDYLISWLYGLTAVACVYFGITWFITGILLYFFLGYTVKDIQNPPPTST